MARPSTKDRIKRMLNESHETDAPSGCGLLPLGLIREALGPTADAAILDLALEGQIELRPTEDEYRVIVVG